MDTTTDKKANKFDLNRNLVNPKGKGEHEYAAEEQQVSTKKQSPQKSVYDRSNLLSQLYCWFALPFLWRHYGKDFDLEAIDVVSRDDSCDHLGTKLQTQWDRELEKQKRTGAKPSLARAMARAFGWVFVLTHFMNFLIYGGFRMAMPMVLGRIIYYANRYFEEKVLAENVIGGDADQNMTTTTISTTTAAAAWAAAISTPALPTPTDFKQNVILYSLLLAAVILGNLLLLHPYFFALFRYGMNIRVSVTRLVFEKALKVSTNAVQRSTVGRIVNLISNDANRFEVAYVYVTFVFCALPETLVALACMYYYIGWASMGTFAIVVVYIPFQSIMANILSRFRSLSITLTDDRLRLMAEILPAMKVIKMYVWERSFSQLVHVARKLEITKIRHSMFLRAINLALYFVAPKIMFFICIFIYLIINKNNDRERLDAEKVFVTMALVAQIREVITYLFPIGVSWAVESYISVKRIEEFLLEEEVKDYQQALPALPTSQVDEEDPQITLKNVSVTSDDGSISILKNITFSVDPGQLTVIIGQVGSGKSSILLSILGELPVKGGGTVQVGGKLIYASQEAWIFAGTVRENILFGRPFEEARYREVVQVAALTKDYQQFEDGDQTVVDDRGTSLSGGQRARISLARALYTDADCYLLDDPLSAVDAAVAKHIFERCIKGFLSKKVVILVTHQLQFIKQAEQIVVLKDGATLAVGSYTDLLAQGIDVFKHAANEVELKAAAEAPSLPLLEPTSPITTPASALLRFRADSIMSEVFRSSRASSFIDQGTEIGTGSDHDSVSLAQYDATSILDYMGSPAQRTTSVSAVIPDGIGAADAAAKKRYNMEAGDAGGGGGGGSNKLKIYYVYFRAGAGLLMFLTFFSSNLLTQVLFTGSDYWLSAWTDYLEQRHIAEANNQPADFVPQNPLISQDDDQNYMIYSAFVALLFVVAIVRTLSYFIICMRSSVQLHDRIFRSLIQAPILFFDRTPVGVLMNRVSRDLGIIDDLLPPTAFEALEILGNCLGVFILCSAMNYYVIIPFILVIVMVYGASKLYVNTARKLKRLEGVARSPMFSQLASSLTGLPTIRSYGVEKLFISRFADTQDLHSATFFTFISCSRIYGIFLDVVCALYIYCLLLVIGLQMDVFTGSVIGLTISQSISLCAALNWGIRQYTEVETYMTSVERVAEFGRLEKEDLEAKKIEPEPNWPPKGDLEYENVSLIYPPPKMAPDQAPEPPKAVLQELSFKVKGGEKVGIVGRTGAGKSSLITTLFRLTQPLGAIRIDGIDTADISLSRLRKSLSIIPQEPILFSGTIRRNLDPFGEATDEQLWDAIEKVQLRAKITSFPAKLDTEISDSGADFSTGQKQLICMCRAILRQSPILVLDEATANVDMKTDALIQSTIRTEFARQTVLTIAHRLDTIIDYDRVLVLDAGRLSQFDAPFALIEAKEGIFYELYSNLGADARVELRQLAKKAAQAKRLKEEMLGVNV